MTFVTHIPLSGGGSLWEPKTKSDCDLDACITALAKLSLGSPPPIRGSNKPSKTTHNPRSRALVTSKLKLTPQLFPSLPRLVSPTLNTTIAVSDGPLPKSTPCYSPPASISCTQNVDIPRSSRRKVSSIPYRRPTTPLSTSPESPPSSYFSHGICRTPSLVSDHGSEASSPSTPPDLASMPIPTSTLAHKGPLVSPLEQFLVPHSNWQDFDFATDFYG